MWNMLVNYDTLELSEQRFQLWYDNHIFPYDETYDYTQLLIRDVINIYDPKLANLPCISIEKLILLFINCLAKTEIKPGN
jgi:hypothetical protein